MIVMEQFGKGLVVEPYMSSIILAGGLISKLGSDNQKESIIPEIISGNNVMFLRMPNHKVGLTYLMSNVQQVLMVRIMLSMVLNQWFLVQVWLRM